MLRRQPKRCWVQSVTTLSGGGLGPKYMLLLPPSALGIPQFLSELIMFSYKGKVISATQGMFGTARTVPACRAFTGTSEGWLQQGSALLAPGGLPSRSTPVPMAGDLPVPTLRPNSWGMRTISRFCVSRSSGAAGTRQHSGLHPGKGFHWVTLCCWEACGGRVWRVYPAWPSVSRDTPNWLASPQPSAEPTAPLLGTQGLLLLSPMCRRWRLLKKEEIRVFGVAKTTISPPQKKVEFQKSSHISCYPI